MRKIRRSIFETNSSSVHSISIVAKEDFEAWKNGEMIFDRWSDKLIKTEDKDKVKYEEDLQTYEDYMEDEYLEYFEEGFTTKSGEEIIAFGKYGYDG